MFKQPSPLVFKTSLMAYSALSYAVTPLMIARLHRLSKKHAGYAKDIRQRFGYLPEVDALSSVQKGKVLWMHAVSVGEVIASEPLVRALLKEFSDLSICLTSTTPTGCEQVFRSFSEFFNEEQACDKDSEYLSDSAIDHKNTRLISVYAPYDLPHVADRFLETVNPIGLVIMETEIWPNWIARLDLRNIPILLVNGRMSEKSAKGYATLSALSLPTFSRLHGISAQTEKDAERFRILGAQNVQVTGNLKADFKITEKERLQAQSLAEIFGLKYTRLSDPLSQQKVLLAASTHKGEDTIILKAFKEQQRHFPELVLLHVPRHPDRADEIGQLCDSLNLKYRLRSSNQPFDQGHKVIICDQLGELRALFGLATLVIMGGTFVDHGGHNPLEPAAWGVGLIAGPSQRNFDLIFDAMEQAGALNRAESTSESLSEQLYCFFQQPEKMAYTGAQALSYVEQSGGATTKNLALCRDLFPLGLASC